MYETNSDFVSAAENGDIVGVEELLSRGVSPDARSRHGSTALMVLSCRYDASKALNDLPIAKMLMDRGADVNAVGSEGMTALMWAAWSGKEEMVKFLLEKGANLDMQNDNGWTALIMATAHGFDRVVEMLIKHYANPNIVAGGHEGAIDIAKAKGYEHIVRMLEPHILAYQKKEMDGINRALEQLRRGSAFKKIGIG